MEDNNDAFPQLGSVYKRDSGCQAKELSRNVANITPTPAQDAKAVAKAWVPQNATPNASPAAWGHSNLLEKLRVQNSGSPWKNRSADSKTVPSIGTSMYYEQNSHMGYGQNSSPQLCYTRFGDWGKIQVAGSCESNNEVSGADDDEDSIDSEDDVEVLFDSDDDDELFDDDSDLDGMEKSHETVKRCKWFKSFFAALEKLPLEIINSSARRWHCPACKGGPGAIDWYRGLEPLINHAKTKKARRAKIHRAFAEVLAEELRSRGSSIALVGDSFGRWEGLNDSVKDYEIVWPPMVIVMNTRYEQEENGKWAGMGNQELLDSFRSYAALKAKHSYGPQGHRGISVLIFESSAAGYFAAARLHQHFREQGRDRNAWDHNRVLFCSGGKRQLYGFIALKEDLNTFNNHSQGRSKLKFEMRSYKEMVESQIKKINEDSQQLVKVKNMNAKQEKQSQALAETLLILREKLQKALDENHIIRQQTKLFQEQNKEEMDSQELFFKEQMKVIHEAIDATEDNFEKLQQAKQEKVKLSITNPSTVEDKHGMDDIARLIKLQDEEMEKFKAEKEKLIKDHEAKKAAITKKYWQDQLELEKVLKNELTLLMEKFAADCPYLQAGNKQPPYF